MTPPKVVIVDYGLGNLRSVAAAIAEVGGVPEITSDVDSIGYAEHIILPGVGAFGLAAEYLQASGIGPAVVSAAEKGTPLLGICLGMQLLFEHSQEFGLHQGLRLIQGDVSPVLGNAELRDLRGTHVGWRSLDLTLPGAMHPLLRQRSKTDSFYFVHSYAGNAVEADNILASVSYGRRQLIAVIGDENVMGVQFHPEKSGPAGLRLLQSFIRM